MGRIIEGRWDCNYCGTKGIKGGEQQCPHCGRKRDKNVKFYIGDRNDYVDEEKAKKVSRNPDWACSFCDTLNSDLDDTCKYCGNTRSDSEKNYFQIKAEQEKEEENSEPIENRIMDMYGVDTYDENDNNKFEDEEMNPDDYYHDFHEKRENKRKTPVNWGGIALGSTFFVLIAMLIFFLFPKNQTLEIQDFSWDRTISIEKYQTVNESGWIVPSGGRLQYAQQEIAYYEDVLDHYETKTREVAKERISHYETRVTGTRDLGNGYFEEITQDYPVYETYYETETYEEPVYRKEPVYKMKYYYEIDKWLHERDVKTSGQDKEPYWGEVVLGEKERESGKHQTLYVTAKNEKDKIKKYTTDEAIWNKLKTGQTVEVKVSGNSIIEIIEENVNEKLSVNITPLRIDHAMVFSLYI